MMTMVEQANMVTTFTMRKRCVRPFGTGDSGKFTKGKLYIKLIYHVLCLYEFRYTSWSFHCVMIRSASSRNVTTIRNRPIAGRYL